MAIIEKRDGKYRVSIRKKGVHISKTFNIEEDAKLFAAWKEDIIDSMSAFSPEIKEIITLDNAIDLKINQLKKQKKDRRSILAVQILKRCFSEFLNTPIHE